MEYQRLTKGHFSVFVFRNIPLFAVLSYRQLTFKKKTKTKKPNVQGVPTKLNNAFYQTTVLSI